MNRIYFLILFLTSIGIGLNAQSVSRSVICGVGATHSNGTATLTSTFGQCPGCTTLSTADGTLTQGFQQPDDTGDCFLNAFDFDSEFSNCGMVFNFFYTGDADINNVTFEWDFGADAFPQTSNLPNPAGVAYSTTGQKMISLRVFDAADCDLQVSTVVNVQAVGFATNPIISDVTCKGETNGAIELETNGGNGPFSYVWSNGETTESLSDLPAGDYAYTVTDISDCESINVVTVAEPQDSLMLNFDVTSETCEGDLNGAVTLNILGGTAPYSISWSDSSSAQTLTGITTGEYFVTVTDGQNCFTEATVFVNEKCNPRIYDTISPNGDGVNDTWVIEDIESFPENNIQIFNRWGELVFEEDGYVNTWAGTTTDGTPLTEGAYYYVIKLNDANNKVLTGSITLVR